MGNKKWGGITAKGTEMVQYSYLLPSSTPVLARTLVTEYRCLISMYIGGVTPYKYHISTYIGGFHGCSW